MDGLYEQFRIALHQVWRRRWLAMAVAWGVAVLGWLVIALIPNSYEAKARLFVQMQSILPNQIGITADERQNQLLRLKQTLTSNENLVRVVRRTDLNSLVASERDLGGVVSSLRQRIVIVAQPDGMLEISARSNISGFSNGQNARTAAATVQGLIDLFIEQNLSGDRRETGQSLQFLDEELRRRETQLQEAEQRRRRVRPALHRPAAGRRHDRPAHVGGARRARQYRAADRRRPGRAQRDARPARRDAAEHAGHGRRRQHGQRPASPRSRRRSASISPAAGPSSIPTSSPSASRSRACGPHAAAERRSGTAGIPNPAYVSLRAMMAEREAAARRRHGAPQPDPVRPRPNWARASRPSPASPPSRTRLIRDYEVLKQQYDQLLANREQVRLRSDVQTRTSPLNIQVVEPPSVPSVPAAPNRPLFLTADPDRRHRRRRRRRLRRRPAPDHLPDPEPARAGDRPAGARHAERGGDAARARSAAASGCSGWAAPAAALGGSYAVLILIEFWQRSQVA